VPPSSFVCVILMPGHEQSAKAYMIELIAKVIEMVADRHSRECTIHFDENDSAALKITLENPRRVVATIIDRGREDVRRAIRVSLSYERNNTSRVIVLELMERHFFYSDGNEATLGYDGHVGWNLHDIVYDEIHQFKVVLLMRDGRRIETHFKDLVDPHPYIRSPPSPAPSPAGSHGWEPTPTNSNSYRPPHVTRSAFGNPSKIKSGHSFSFRSSDFTGSGSKRKLRNGITYTELENTANSGGYKTNPVVYAHTSEHNRTEKVRKNTGRDPTRLFAPLSSFRALGGQLHPTLGNPANPMARYPMGHQNLRKIPGTHVHAALKLELVHRNIKALKEKHEREMHALLNKKANIQRTYHRVSRKRAALGDIHTNMAALEEKHEREMHALLNKKADIQNMKRQKRNNST